MDALLITMFTSNKYSAQKKKKPTSKGPEEVETGDPMALLEPTKESQNSEQAFVFTSRLWDGF